MRRTAVALVALVVTLSPGCPVRAQGGGVPIRINDGQKSRCIDGTKDRVWLTLRRLILTKESKWLTKNKGVGVLLRANLRVEDDQEKAVSFPLMSEATLESYSNGQVSVPIEHVVVAGLRLQQDKIRYAAMGVDVTILNRQGKTAWGKGLEVLAKVTSKLPIPASPAREAGAYLLDYANKVVDAEVEKQNLADKAKSATLALEFSPTAQCKGTSFEETGTIAVLYANGVPGDSLIPLQDIDKHCWTADLKPAFLLKAAKREEGDDCVSLRERTWFQVSNNYFAFVLNAVGGTGVLGPETADDRKTGLERCKANGIDQEVCLGS